MKLLNILCLIISFSLVSCDRSKDQNTEKKTEELNQKEQQLMLWERQLKSKEDSLLVIQKALDSTKIYQDTTGTFNSALIGKWRVKMLCTETSCEGSAVGDTKTEQWNISYYENKYIVEATSNNQVLRTYNGLFKDNRLQVTAQQPAAKTLMNVTLQQTKEKLLEGIREIIKEEDCKIVYSLSLEKM